MATSSEWVWFTATTQKAVISHGANRKVTHGHGSHGYTWLAEAVTREATHGTSTVLQHDMLLAIVVNGIIGKASG